MKQIWAIFLLLSFLSCDTSTTTNTTDANNDPSQQTTAIADKTPPQKAKKQGNLDYTIHTNNNGPKAEIGKFLTMHMKYTTQNDSLIFTSFERPKPLTFRFSKTLFKGVLNEGLQEMASGDSATFRVPAERLYGSRLPAFAKPGDNLIYTIKLEGIEDKPAYSKPSQNNPLKVTKRK